MAQPLPDDSVEDNQDETAVCVSNEEEEDSKQHDDDSFLYESDYSYNDEDSITAGHKRKTPASVSSADFSCPTSKVTKGGLKTTGLDDDDGVQISSSHSSLPLSTPQCSPGDRNVCGVCQREAHLPVFDCSMIADWEELTENKASGILAVHPASIAASMDRRVRECVERLATLRAEYEDIPAGIFDRSAEVVAVDLRRFHYNVENWQNAFRQRADLEQQLQGARGYAAGTAAQIQQMIDRLGLDEHYVPNNANAPGNNSNEPLDSRVQQIQQDHDRFLRATLAEVQQPPRQTSATAAASSGGSPANFVSNFLVKPLAKIIGKSNLTTGLATATARDNTARGSLLSNPRLAVPGFPSLKATTQHLTDTGSQTGRNVPESAREEVRQQADANTAMERLAAVASNVQTQPEDAAWVCEICMDDEVAVEDRLSLECSHEYCRDCWSQFILGMLEDARGVGGVLATPVYCPHPNCRRFLTRPHMQQLAIQWVPMYDEIVLNSFVQGHNSTMRWCPGPTCDKVVVHSRRGLFLHDNGTVDPFAKCGYCNTRFCFDCGDAPHEGRTCLRIYDEGTTANNLGNDAENGEGNTTQAGVGPRPQGRVALAGRAGILGAGDREETKTDKKIRACPNCHVPIEKNGGCHHMRCTQCSTHFCWLCMADMSSGMHWCGREPGMDDARRGRNPPVARPQIPALERIDLDYIAETVQQPNPHCDTEVVKTVLEKRQDLQRFAHYYNRVTAHNQGQVFAENQCDCVAGRAFDFTRVSELNSCMDTEFFDLANQRLVDCRRTLKYTYVFLFFKLASISNEENNGFEDNECPADSANSSKLPTHLALFLDHQERLERMTERLSFLSENALTRKDRKRVVDMINTVERCIQAVTALSFQERDAKPTILA